MMKKFVLCLAVLALMVQGAFASALIDGAIGNGNFESDGAGSYTGPGGIDATSPDWDGYWNMHTAIPGTKFYFEGSVTRQTYYNGWTLRRDTYGGGNNTIGLISYSNPLANPGDLAGFSNGWSWSAISNTFDGVIADGDQFDVQFVFANKSASTNMEVKAYLVFDAGLATENAILVGTDTADGATEQNLAKTFNASYMLSGESYSSVALEINLINDKSGAGSNLDDVVLTTTGADLVQRALPNGVVPEPATIGLLSVGALFLRRKTRRAH